MKTNRRGFLKSLTAIPLAIALSKVEAVSAANEYFEGTTLKFKPEHSNTGSASAKAWVNFDSSKNPPEILGGFNVSGVSKGANIGQYQINFENPIYIATHETSVAVVGGAKNNQVIQGTKKNNVIGVIVYE